MTSQSAAAPSQTATASAPVHRFEVRPREEIGDPAAAALVRDARGLGVDLASARTARVYLVQAELSEQQRRTVASQLLADPVTETVSIGAAGEPERVDQGSDARVIEVHPLPGVMDPVAQSVREAIADLVGVDAAVATGWRYELADVSQPQARRLAERLLANTVIHAIHEGAFTPDSLPRGTKRDSPLRHIPLRDLSAGDLAKLSREAHLFLSPEEMRAIQAEYRRLGREPTDIELETLAQTWSEHCVHKTLKSRVVYREEAVPEEGQRDRGTQGRRGGDVSFAFTSSGKGVRETGQPAAAEGAGEGAIDGSNRPGHTVNADGSVTIDNLLKSTVAAATHELIADGVDWTLSVFVDNAGIIRFDDHHAVCVKVETHNHPSAIEPYGGAATGAGGCIRDIIGTGLAALPVANTDVFCVAFPEHWHAGENAEKGEIANRKSQMANDAAQGPDLPFISSSAISAPNSAPSVFPLPTGCLHPHRILTQVVAGVRDYGNRMGIPTVNGAVYFDDRYVGNPLVFCGCIGVMPADLIKGEAKAGDLIVALGGRTGRDGIHGATFSSAELTDTHADEFAHAVQIGNPIEEKRVLDAIMRARGGGKASRQQGIKASSASTSQSLDASMPPASMPLFSAITDCGAGGFSSAVGEMGEKLGAEVHLDRAPLKYEGLTYTEIWISEAQERMVLAVPESNLAALQQICDEEHVELAVLGRFGTPAGAGGPELILNYNGQEVGRLPMSFLHDGIPQVTREAVWTGGSTEARRHEGTKGKTPSPREALLKLLAHPNIASKHRIIRQYDHEVRGGTVGKPLVGPLGRGPSDAAVIRPVTGSDRGLAIACGLATGIGDPARGGDPYQMALAGIDECVRNLVCAGANPGRIAILDNFCWPSCDDAESMGWLVRAAAGCYDGAKAYRTPFISGKDSLNNQFTMEDGRKIRIPPTLLISGVGIVEDVSRCVSMDVKASGNHLYLVEPHERGDDPNGVRLRGSHYERLFGLPASNGAHGGAGLMPYVDLEWCPRVARAVAEAIRLGLIASAHDVSDGGPLCAVAEMLLAGSTPQAPIGATFTLIEPELARAFSERPGAYILEITPEHHGKFFQLMEARDVSLTRLGETTNDGVLRLEGDVDEDVSVEELARVWRGEARN
jgi:phosphoribosylformylglycinamidine synthase